MKKWICIIVILIVCCLLSTCGVAYADATTSAYTYFKEYATDYEDRSVGTANEKAAAQYLATKLGQFGYTARNGSSSMIEEFQFLASVSAVTGEEGGSILDMIVPSQETVEVSTGNVVGFKKSTVPNAPLFVIGANYSNYVTTNIDGEPMELYAAGYSASAVGTLLAVAEGLADVALPYDLAIVFFSAELFGDAGVEAFLDKTQQEIAGYIHLSQVAIGDELNLYAGETESEHGKFLMQINEKYGHGIQGKPFNPGYFMSDVFDLPQVHPGLADNHAYFMQKGIPSAHLFGYLWKGGSQNAESASRPDIAYTKDDTFEKVIELYGRDAVQARLDNAATFLIRAATASEFSTVWHECTDFALTDSKLSMILSIVMAAVIIVVVVVLGVVLHLRAKKAGTPDFSVNSEFINGKPAEDIEVFDDFVIPGDSASVESQEEPEKPAETEDDIFGEF
ncbi:MAG: M28 family peptidase [Clostridia bacterium]|nr:M28 family peptidase [Clostridia bacterium]